MKFPRFTQIAIVILLSSAMLWSEKVKANLDYSPGLYWGSGLSRIILKGAPGNPDFLVPVISANIETSDHIMYQFRLAYSGRSNDFVDLDTSFAVYAIYQFWTDGFVRPFGMIGFSSTKYNINPLFSQSSTESTSGLSAGFGLKFINSERLHYAIELIGLNYENEDLNYSITGKVYYSF